MNKFKAFFTETYAELVQKVSWPTWDELMASAIVVTVATLIIAVMVLAMDKASGLAMTTFYDLF